MLQSPILCILFIYLLKFDKVKILKFIMSTFVPKIFDLCNQNSKFPNILNSSYYVSVKLLLKLFSIQICAYSYIWRFGVLYSTL